MPMIRRSPLSRIFSSRRSVSTTTVASQQPVTLGIRREDPERIWERRCPLTPDAVEHLVRKEGVKVLVQDCDRRVFPISDFVKVCIGVTLNLNWIRDVLSHKYYALHVHFLGMRVMLTPPLGRRADPPYPHPCAHYNRHKRNAAI